MAAAFALEKEELGLFQRNLRFLAEAVKLDHGLEPRFATANTVALELHTLRLRAYGEGGSRARATLVDAPYAGHTATIADYHAGQSLVETLLASGLRRVFLTDWKSATPEMKDYDIDNYLAELVVSIDDLGGRGNLIGLCQGGWLCAMAAARFPDKVNSLVLAGALGKEGIAPGSDIVVNERRYGEYLNTAFEAPKLAGDPPAIAKTVRPAGQPLTFTVPDAQGKPVRLKPYHQIAHERYVTYWQVPATA